MGCTIIVTGLLRSIIELHMEKILAPNGPLFLTSSWLPGLTPLDHLLTRCCTGIHDGKVDSIKTLNILTASRDASGA